MNQENLFAEYKKIFEIENLSETQIPEEKKSGIFGYSPFALQDAIGERNVKKMWLEYEKLRFAGIEAEDIIHKIVSKVRDMSAISQGASKEDLGIKDYPFSKSKKDLKNWTSADLQDFYSKLVEIYHRSRMGGDNLDIAIEKTFLNIFNT